MTKDDVVFKGGTLSIELSADGKMISGFFSGSGSPKAFPRHVESARIRVSKKSKLFVDGAVAKLTGEITAELLRVMDPPEKAESVGEDKGVVI